MSILAVILAGIAAGWLIQFLTESDHKHIDQLDDLEGYRPTKDDLVDWDHHTKGGRRG